MNMLNYQIDYELQETVFSILHKKLGITNLIRVMQIDKGYDNYTLDRNEWQQKYTVDKLFNKNYNKF